MSKAAAWRNKREPKLVRRDPPHPEATHLWEQLVPLADTLDKKKAQFLLDVLQSSVTDPDIDFGPAYGMACEHKREAQQMLHNYIAAL